jgi:hypothetical protein
MPWSSEAEGDAALAPHFQPSEDQAFFFKFRGFSTDLLTAGLLTGIFDAFVGILNFRFNCVIN